MSTILFPSPIFGPVHSRRLGVSLGINLLPAHKKLCNFDCVYCECGLKTKDNLVEKLPTRNEVSSALEQQLERMVQEGVLPDVITFAGNGEPSIHPAFSEIIDDTIALRDKYAPKSKISVLSNATLIDKPKVRSALMKVDNNILKLDTIDRTYISRVDQPYNGYDITKTIEGLKAFNGHVIIQTMFLKGTLNGESVDNTSDAYVLPWVEALKYIRPSEVMIYTIERETPTKTLLKASKEELDRIVAMLAVHDIKASASY